jgi:CPA1 family monovalent cation:H+ antiporter
MAGILFLLGIAMASALVVQRVRLPYTIVLVLVGLALGSAGVRPGFDLDRDLILHVFLPLLLFEAALRVDLGVLREAWLPIVVLAVPGVVLSTMIVGVGLHLLIGIGLGSAVLFGALISATDPVAVLAAFKRLKIPERLAMVVEGESVLNDGTALVLFTLLLPVANGASVNPVRLPLQFVGVLAGGLGVGAALGWLGGQVVRLLDDHLAEITLSALIAYGSFLAAERLQVSGVIATVSAGLVFASQGWGGLSRPARELLVDVWEFGAFVGNSLLFLLIGLKVHLRQFGGIWDDLLWAAAITLVARFVAVYGFALLLRWFGRPFLSRQALLVAWSGLRGALGIALALSLPGELVDGQLLLRLAAGVILFTLLAQGLTLEPLLRRLHRSTGWPS